MSGPQPRTLPVADPAALADQIRRAAYQAGIEQGEPMAPLIELIARAVTVLGETEQRVETAIDGIPGRIDRSLEAATTLAVAESKRQQAGFTGMLGDGAVKFGQLALQEFGDQLKRQVFHTWLRFAVATGLVLSIAIVGADRWGFARGYGRGHDDAQSTIHQTEWRLNAAFAHGSVGADLWAVLMESNDIAAAIKACHGSNLIDTGARKACQIPLWVEPDNTVAAAQQVAPQPLPVQPQPSQPARTAAPAAPSQPLSALGVTLPRPQPGMVHFGPEGSR